jgi:hypothetical protein
VTTNDGKHLLDLRLPAAGGTPVMTDVTFPASIANDGAGGTRTFTGVLPTGDCPESGVPPVFGLAANTSVSLTGVTAQSITGVYATSDATQAFATYLPVSGAAATGAKLPLYTPATGIATSVTLAAGATAPVSGVFSSDNKTFFTGTSGDNKVHLITRSTLTDSSQLNPNLPSLTTGGGTAVPNLLVQYPRSVLNN